MKTFKRRKEQRPGRQSVMAFQRGYTLMELMVTLSIVSLLTVSMVSLNLGDQDRIGESAFNAESRQILYTLLQYQNEAMMDGCRRRIRFQDKSMLILWTKDEVMHQVLIPVENVKFSGAYTGTNSLDLYPQGTVSKAGTVTLTSPTGAVRYITVQLGNGRIYLDEP